jgi:hypothetical protein
MDTSKEYIDMCEKAQEIQELRSHYRDWESQDFCVKIAENGTYDVESSNAEDFEILRFNTTQKGVVWIPRQDQLQDMVKDLPEFKGRKHGFVETAALRFYEYAGINTRILGLNSFEKQWLAFVMREKYNKKWNFETKQWEVV